MILVNIFLIMSFVRTLNCLCPKSLSLDISNGVKINSTITMDEITFNENDYYYENNKTFGCICNVKLCIKKCDNVNDTSAGNSSLSVLTTPYKFFNLDMPLEVNEEDFYFVYGKICSSSNQKIILQEQHFYLQRNGSLLFTFDKLMYPPDKYCIDIINGSMHAEFCAPEEEENPFIYVKIAGMIVSMPFLLITFLVYAIMPESNIHRKALMNYVLTLFVAYIVFVVVQLDTNGFGQFECSLLGYMIMFFFLVSFFWMNVMCLDMWFAFSDMKRYNGRNIVEKKRFLLYFAYAFGFPMIHTLVVLLINEKGNPSSSYYPGVGNGKCFLSSGLPNFLYFYGPITILITINIILFTLTAVKIQTVKRETSVLKHCDSKKHSYEDDKQTFNLYLKLLFAMGINWSMEIISFVIEWKSNGQVPLYVWYLTDFFNAVYGVLIFFIFVCKRKIWNSLKRRYYIFIGKPQFTRSMSVTQITRLSNYSHRERTIAKVN